jgi:hypothetical protein
LETLAQLNADFWIITFGLLFIFGWIFAIAAIWKMFAFFRDVHQIRESLEWIAYAQRKVAESEKPLPKPEMVSQFGR